MLLFVASACQLFHLRVFAGLELSKVAETAGRCYRKLSMSYPLFHLVQTSVISFCFWRPSSFWFSFINWVGAVLWPKKVAILLNCASSFASVPPWVFCAARLAVSALQFRCTKFAYLPHCWHCECEQYPYLVSSIPQEFWHISPCVTHTYSLFGEHSLSASILCQPHSLLVECMIQLLQSSKHQRWRLPF